MPPTQPSTNDFIDRFPVFSSVGFSSIDAALMRSSNLQDSSAWGDFWEEAVFLETAHELVLEGAIVDNAAAINMAGGLVSSVSGAGMSVSLSGPLTTTKSLSDAWYMRTLYGQKYLRLRSSVMSPALMSI